MMPVKRAFGTQATRVAFTLIELLVVIAIIAILAAILFPVFAQVREKARQSACLSNEKQLGLAFMQYAQDFDETAPYGNKGANGTNPVGVGWAGQIYPYVKNVGVFQCPNDNDAYTVIPTANSTPQYPWYIDSYMFNENILTGPLSSEKSPALTVMICEVSASAAHITNPLEQDSSVGNGYYGAGYHIYRTGGLGIGQALDTTGKIPSPFPAATLPTGGCDEKGNGGGFGANQWSGQHDTSANPASATGFGYGFVSWVTTGWHNDGSNFICADGHAKWSKGTSVAPGGNATSPGQPPRCDHSAPVYAGSTDYVSSNSPWTLTFSIY